MADALHDHLQLTPPTVEASSGSDFPVLFHYTNFYGVAGILNAQELWATSIYYMNDAAEFKDAIFRAKQIINQRQEHATADIKPLLDQLSRAISRIEKMYIHVFSFSEVGNLLSQWRAYCPKGGVSIGFTYDDLKKLANHNKFYLLRCVYNDDEKDTLLNATFERAISGFTKEGETIDACKDTFLLLLTMIGPCFKDHAFHEKREWRLISQWTALKNEFIDVRATDSMLKPYFRFSLQGLPDREDGKRKLGFSSFMIGPQNNEDNKDLIVRALSFLVTKYNIDFSAISKSPIPYRTVSF